MYLYLLQIPIVTSPVLKCVFVSVCLFVVFVGGLFSSGLGKMASEASCRADWSNPLIRTLPLPLVSGCTCVVPYLNLRGRPAGKLGRLLFVLVCVLLCSNIW